VADPPQSRKRSVARFTLKEEFLGMKELEEILQLWNQAEASGQSAVLATVVKTRGSSYRLPGARLLLARNGQRTGSISGGCLEDDLIKKAWWLTEHGPAIKKYDTTPEREMGSGFGLGCNGIIHILLERLTPGDPTVLTIIRDARSERRAAAIAHLIHPPGNAGQRLVIDTLGKLSHNLPDAAFAASLEQECKLALSELTSRTVLVGEEAEAFVEIVRPAVRLLVFGAGDDAIPITSLAHYLGWQVWVFDGRAHYARREKFPHADKVLVRSAGNDATVPPIDPWTAAILMSHSYSQDLEMLRELSTAGLNYLGVLGPQKRTRQLLSDASLDALRIGPTLHSPMGLDIGADGPEQVALAAIAEIQAVLNGRTGGLLRERAGSIHSATDREPDPKTSWAQTACLL
jgi:xanthine dehydrogenase accessory factor